MVAKLLGYSNYSFIAKQTGELIEGVACHFNDTTLYPDFKGSKVFVKNISNGKLGEIPLILNGLYDLVFKIDVSKNTVNFESISVKK